MDGAEEAREDRARVTVGHHPLPAEVGEVALEGGVAVDHGAVHLEHAEQILRQGEQPIALGALAQMFTDPQSGGGSGQHDHHRQCRGPGRPGWPVVHRHRISAAAIVMAAYGIAHRPDSTDRAPKVARRNPKSPSGLRYIGSDHEKLSRNAKGFIAAVSRSFLECRATVEAEGRKRQTKEDEGCQPYLRTRELLQTIRPIRIPWRPVNGSMPSKTVIEREGPERAHFLLEQMLDVARRSGANIPFSNTTGYVNTIPTQLEAPRRATPSTRSGSAATSAGTRWRWWCGPTSSSPPDGGDLGGHIASFASLATMIGTGMNHFWHAPHEGHGGDLVYFQGHSSPGPLRPRLPRGTPDRGAAATTSARRSTARGCRRTRTRS